MPQIPFGGGIDQVELEGLLSAFFTSSKNMWTWAVALSVVAILSGVGTAAFYPQPPWWIGVPTGLFAFLGTALRWRSDSLRTIGEELLRGKEFRDGIGRPLDAKRIADLKEDYSHFSTTAARRQAEQDNFYDTLEPLGPARLVEMLRESSWWTERLARRGKTLATATSLALGASCLYALPLGTLVSGIPLAGSSLISFYTGLIGLFFTGDLARLIAGYAELSANARSSYRTFDALSGDDQVSLEDVLIAAFGYQLSRSQAPPIPTWLWRWRRGTLNALWATNLAHSNSSNERLG